MTVSMTKVENLTDDAKTQRLYKVKAGVFLSTVACVSAFIGFSKTVASAKKHDQKFLEKAPNAAALMEGGTFLAMRALAWGTLYACLGTGALCYGIWKLSGARDMAEFRQRVGTALPRIPKNEAPMSRTEFDGLTDLLKYLSAWGKE